MVLFGKRALWVVVAVAVVILCALLVYVGAVAAARVVMGMYSL